jgi:exodeoxyribonuclease VII small subunit
MTNNKQASFESSFDKLREAVTALETNDISIEDATLLFEQGTKLAKLCNRLLSDAEMKISTLQRTLDQDTNTDTSIAMESNSYDSSPLFGGEEDEKQ